MIRNLLAVVGLLVVVRKGYEAFCHYQEVQEENETLRSMMGDNNSKGPENVSA
ncbi:hypothetical protein ACMHYJ_16285 [Castellaniella hirudinis]|uniref:hypothetical protein n=1 Tax=Castellaniella hirudinis TaxID=1144617 RepID=UPI0039C23FC2